MSDAPTSVLLWCWHDARTNALQVRVVRSETSEEVTLKDGAFLLRCWSDQNGQVERCMIRHLASNREAYIQGGPKLREFIKASLLDSEAKFSPSDAASD